MTKLHSHLKKGFISILSLTLIISNISVYAMDLDNSNIIIEEDNINDDESIQNNDETILIKDNEDISFVENSNNINQINIDSNVDNNFIPLENYVDDEDENHYSIYNPDLDIDNFDYSILEDENFEYDKLSNSQKIVLNTIIQDSTPLTISNEILTTIDLTNGITDTAPQHTHIWNYKYDSVYHWQQCSICNIIKNKTSHILSGNGGSKIQCDNQTNSAYRDICGVCGYQSSPQIVLHGRYENYATSKKINYGSLRGVSLNNIKQITKIEFNNLLSSYKSSSCAPNGQNYTWYDDNGDGYGWVFCGGPIIGDSSGIKGTIELIVGSEGDYGRKIAFDEYFLLAKYISNDSTPTRGEFVSFLQQKINSSSNPTSHLAYGYNIKYSSKVNDTQFTKLVTEFKGYYTHNSSWGWVSMNIQHAGHHNDGNSIFSNTSCYDSNNKHNISFNDGIPTTCDICGSTYTGNENYTNQQWVRCAVATKIKNGQTITCGGHNIYGKNNIYLGKIICTFSKNNNQTYVQWKVYPASNGTVTFLNSTIANGVTSSNGVKVTQKYLVPKQNYSTLISYAYPCCVKFKVGNVEREFDCGYYYEFNDCNNPIAYGYSNNTTNNSYWKVIGNGTASKSSTQAQVKVTFKDLAEYSLNTLKVIIYDEDKKTIIKQVNGNSEVPLVLISGNNGTNGGQTLWQATIPINTETSSSKNIYIQAIDSTGNKSDLIPMQVSYLDAIGPKMTTTINSNEWSTFKTISNTVEDISGIYLGVSQKDLTYVSNETYNNTRDYKIIGDIYGSKNITIYAKDTAGNMSYKTLEVSNLDNTSPTITKVESSKTLGSTSLTVTANDINTTLNKSGSGVNKYIITSTNSTPSEDDSNWQTSNILKVTTPGTYYIFAKDLVGNISNAYEVKNVKVDYTLSINPNGGSWNNSSTTQEFTITNGDTKTISNPSKVGYTFKNWTLNGTNAKFENSIFTMGIANASLVANWNINQYNVTYIDVVDSINGTQLGKTTKKVNYNSTVRGSDIGSSTSDNVYYNGYYYSSDTSATVTTNGATVYRIFKLRTIDKTSNLTWNDNNNKNGFRPSKYTLKLMRNGSLFKQVELTSSQTSYTFSNLTKYDSKGNAFKYTFQVDASDRYKITLDSNGNTITENYQNSTFSVTIPKTISLNGFTGKGNYNIKVNGTFYYNDTLTVTPSNSFTLKDSSGVSILQANVTQNVNTFTKDNLGTTSGSISLNKTKFAGKYNGTFNFNIKFVMKN